MAKFTTTIPDPTLDKLREIAARKGISVTEALRQAIERDAVIVGEAAAGSRVLIEDKDKKLKQLIVF